MNIAVFITGSKFPKWGAIALAIGLAFLLYASYPGSPKGF